MIARANVTSNPRCHSRLQWMLEPCGQRHSLEPSGKGRSQPTINSQHPSALAEHLLTIPITKRVYAPPRNAAIKFRGIMDLHKVTRKPTRRSERPGLPAVWVWTGTPKVDLPFDDAYEVLS